MEARGAVAGVTPTTLEGPGASVAATQELKATHERVEGTHEPVEAHHAPGAVSLHFDVKPWFLGEFSVIPGSILVAGRAVLLPETECKRHSSFEYYPLSIGE